MSKNSDSHLVPISGPLYRGDAETSSRLRLNPLGILWLVTNPVVAEEYAMPYYRDVGTVWRVALKPDARIYRLKDIDAPPIRKLFEDVNAFARVNGVSGVFSESYWRKSADFGILETYRWAAKFLARKRVDGLLVSDTLTTTPIPHESLALLRLSAISKAEREVVSREKLGVGGRGESCASIASRILRAES